MGQLFLPFQGLVWGQHLRMAWLGAFSVDVQLPFFLPTIGNGWLQTVCLQCGRTGIFFSFCRESVFSQDPSQDAITQAAVQWGGAIRSCLVPPQKGAVETVQLSQDKRGLLPLFSGDLAHWWVPPHPQPQLSEHFYLCFQAPHGALSSILRSLHPGWWMVSLDLNDAYLNVLILQSH